MLEPSAEQFQDLREAILLAAQNPGLASAIDAIYAGLQIEVDARRPVCLVSGRCCRFEAYGHRLFVTTAEMGVFKRQSLLPAALPIVSDWNGDGCPYQVRGLCGAHAIRPFGCRIYFCDGSSTEWQHQIYERFHAELKKLHDVFQLPYFYIEWRIALRAANLIETG